MFLVRLLLSGMCSPVICLMALPLVFMAFAMFSLYLTGWIHPPVRFWGIEHYAFLVIGFLAGLILLFAARAARSTLQARSGDLLGRLIAGAFGAVGGFFSGIPVAFVCMPPLLAALNRMDPAIPFAEHGFDAFRHYRDMGAVVGAVMMGACLAWLVQFFKVEPVSMTHSEQQEVC